MSGTGLIAALLGDGIGAGGGGDPVVDMVLLGSHVRAALANGAVPEFPLDPVPVARPAVEAAAALGEVWGSYPMACAGEAGQDDYVGSIWTVRRSADDAKLAGVCAGLARHWGVDPTLVRVGCAMLALSAGLGIVLYLAGALLIPADGKDRAAIDDLLGARAKTITREAWIAIVGGACLLALVLLGQLTPFGFGPAVVLALIWYFGYYKNRTRTGPGAPPASSVGAPPANLTTAPPPPQPFRYPGPETAFTRAAEAWQRRVYEQSVASGGAGVAAGAAGVPAQPGQPDPSASYFMIPGAQPVPQPRPEAVEQARFLSVPDPVGLYAQPEPMLAAISPQALTPGRSLRARRLRLVALLVAGLTIGGLGMADAAGVAVSPTAYLAAALLVAGLTLLAAAWLGRARGVLPVALLLLVATGGATAAGPISQSVGEVDGERTYTTLAALPPGGDRQQLGALTVDLRELRVDRSVTYTASVGFGYLKVEVPDDVQVRVRYQASGTVTVLDGEPVEGDQIQGVVEPTSRTRDEPVLTLDLAVDNGEIRVRE